MKLNPHVLTVMGGPNLALEPGRPVAYLDQHPEIDVYITGEGDFAANDLLNVFMDGGLSHKVFGARGVQSAMWRNPEGQVVRNDTRARRREINDIPSPWLGGAQDDFFDGRLAPMIETNRGCPFTCTFCAQGTSWYSKVNNFDLERVKEEIHYIARRIKDKSPNMGTLRITDSNYGMVERDIEISGFIGKMQRDYNWPTFIDATTGKNRPERIIKSVEQVSRALLEARGVTAEIADFDRFWQDFTIFVRLSHATGDSEAKILAPTAAVLNYDIAAWLASGNLSDPSACRLMEPTQFVFKLTADGEDELSKALSVWTTHIRGLSKLVTRVRTESQVRQCRRTNRALPMTGDSIAAE